MKSAFYQMLAVALPIIFFVDLPAGSPSKPPDPSEQCVQKLVAIAKSATAATLTSSGDRVRIGSKEVRIRAQIEADERSPDNKKYLIGLRVDVFVGGVLQPLTFGSVGIGSARSDAVETAVSDWALYVGDVLLAALGVKIGEEPLNVGPFLVYQGLVGIRGSHSPWSTEKNGQLLHRLDSLMKGLGHSPGELHSISLMYSSSRTARRMANAGWTASCLPQHSRQSSLSPGLSREPDMFSNNSTCSGDGDEQLEDSGHVGFSRQVEGCFRDCLITSVVIAPACWGCAVIQTIGLWQGDC